jgi:hypothetical protein
LTKAEQPKTERKTQSEDQGRTADDKKVEGRRSVHASPKRRREDDQAANHKDRGKQRENRFEERQARKRSCSRQRVDRKSPSNAAMPSVLAGASQVPFAAD